MVPDSVLSMVVLRAIDLYNSRIRPLLEARTVSSAGSRFEVVIEGVECEECGLEELVEDLIDVMNLLDLDARVESVADTESGVSIVVRVSPRRPVSAS
ncbi:MAG: hypothetical protein GSR84_05385 [Desulfurococcales archaeon]|nr:hypothetical protein [Desulfurococcales archaeon]